MLFPLKVGIDITKSSNNIDSHCLVQSQTEQLFICRLVSCYHNFPVLQLLFKLKAGFSPSGLFSKYVILIHGTAYEWLLFGYWVKPNVLYMYFCASFSSLCVYFIIQNKGRRPSPRSATGLSNVYIQIWV